MPMEKPKYDDYSNKPEPGFVNNLQLMVGQPPISESSSRKRTSREDDEANKEVGNVANVKRKLIGQRSCGTKPSPLAQSSVPNNTSNVQNAKKNVNDLVNMLFGFPRPNLFFVWHQDHCQNLGRTMTGKPIYSKPLKKVWLWWQDYSSDFKDGSSKSCLSLLGCTGIVMFLHAANFMFHALAHQISIGSFR
ncbi:hypothetical protein L1887_20697 [Cichorium endivia]|nr:hypothetical protein L1887_20697 [Cichorium endivia]